MKPLPIKINREEPKKFWIRKENNNNFKWVLMISHQLGI